MTDSNDNDSYWADMRMAQPYFKFGMLVSMDTMVLLMIYGILEPETRYNLGLSANYREAPNLICQIALAMLSACSLVPLCRNLYLRASFRAHIESLFRSLSMSLPLAICLMYASISAVHNWQNDVPRLKSFAAHDFDRYHGDNPIDEQLNQVMRQHTQLKNMITHLESNKDVFDKLPGANKQIAQMIQAFINTLQPLLLPEDEALRVSAVRDNMWLAGTMLTCGVAPHIRYDICRWELENYQKVLDHCYPRLVWIDNHLKPFWWADSQK